MTDLLEAAGNATVERDGKKTARKRIAASMAWELVTAGETTLSNGKKLILSPQDWVGLYKWIYGHIDGPPKSEIDLHHSVQTYEVDLVEDDESQNP